MEVFESTNGSCRSQLDVEEGDIRVTLPRVPHVAVLPFPTMTFHSTSNTTSILEDGKLKPGVYKIQNLHSGKYLDIHEHSNAVCCRPAPDLTDGKGLVRLSPLSAARISYLIVESGRSKALGMDIP